MLKRALLALVIGLGLGVLVGVSVGWFRPIQDVRAGFEEFHPEYRADYTVMVAQSYAVTGDWDLAQQRIGRLGLSDPAGYVVTLTERYISENRSPEHIRSLVRLSARYGFVTPPMEIYLPDSNQP